MVTWAHLESYRRKLELFRQQLDFRLWLRVAREVQFASIGGWDVDIDHLRGRELFEHAARGPSRLAHADHRGRHNRNQRQRRFDHGVRRFETAGIQWQKE